MQRSVIIIAFCYNYLLYCYYLLYLFGLCKRFKPGYIFKSYESKIYPGLNLSEIERNDYKIKHYYKVNMESLYDRMMGRFPREIRLYIKFTQTRYKQIKLKKRLNDELLNHLLNTGLYISWWKDNTFRISSISLQLLDSIRNMKE